MPQYPGNIKTKLPKVGTTIFTVMNELAHQYKAINLSQGFPEFDAPKELKKIAEKYVRSAHHQYAHAAGLISLRERIAEKIEQLYGGIYHPEHEITITAGGTIALYSAISAVIQEDDEVLIFSPAYDSYAPAVQLNGGMPIHIPLQTPDFSIPWELVKKMINHKTRMIILCNPHNPSGSIFSLKDIEQLKKILKGSEIILLSDEVYEHLVFDQKKHLSIAAFPELAERSFIVFSFGKTYHVTGWKIGYCIAPKNLMDEFRKVHQYQTFSVNTPLQYALSEFIQQKEFYLSLSNFYQAKRDVFVQGLKHTKFDIIPASGSYFQLLGYQNISEEKDIDLAVRLIKEYGIAAIPISVFYHRNTDSKYLRFCFAKEEATLLRALEKLIEFSEKN